ncbi:hypothetical protein [Clostridium botulinum]|uniref:hypothetical protein n=1 Tax=Clostridium botulinum TaxID=1491 RepID=UPI000773CF2C|nr:hypothetical protein [Clostridium botulinum]MBY6836266.1 hypothetical protein [Clostridium botulinum]MBY6931867.1 hypothetical protein [Clostridium botulinum]NFG20567.1 hypothetical protein [Clostridium botulinum]NFG63672.1 hypothetical protein [Clostridium botulinum]NFO81125.1 hypothetical protein [Clostridium botulinum]
MKIEDDVMDTGKEFVKNTIKGLNIFTVFHVVWLIEIYYLGLNSLLNNETIKQAFEIVKLPVLVERYNNLILGYFKEWNYFIFLLSAGLFICGFAFSFIKTIPGLSYYNIIYRYCSQGGYISGWLFLIYLSYIAYLNLGTLCLLIPMLIAIFNEVVKKIRNKLNAIII